MTDKILKDRYRDYTKDRKEKNPQCLRIETLQVKDYHFNLRKKVEELTGTFGLT